jgi:hypothetical protein
MQSDSRSAIKISVIVAIIGLCIGLFGLGYGISTHQARPLIGYLMGVGYWMAPMIGLLIFTMLLYVFDAGWSAIIRRQMEHLLSAFKWVALLMLPLIILAWVKVGGSPAAALLWKWLSPSQANDPMLLHKSGYLNPVFFTIRSLLFLGLWIFLAHLFRRESFATDKDGNAKHYSRCRLWGAGGIVLMGLSLTFASIDWFKSLEFHWFSTMYGVWFFAAGMFSAIALTIITVRLAEKNGVLKGLISSSQYYLLGCLMLAFTVFWAYISFSQYLITFCANIPEETFWYVMREITVDGKFSSWGYLSVFALLFGHFLIPFLSLLFFSSKVNTWRLFGIAIWCLVLHAADIYWNILPGKIYVNGHEAYRPFDISIWEVATIIGIGGIVVASYLKSSQKHSALPAKDPRVAEALHYHI